ncbi:MAG: hypothetical protein V1831_00535 [Candidatus Woesearchaeota archaeon]
MKKLKRYKKFEIGLLIFFLLAFLLSMISPATKGFRGMLLIIWILLILLAISGAILPDRYGGTGFILKKK